VESTHVGWSEDDSRDFLRYGDCLIPDREEQIDVICSLLPPPVGNRTILDLCCGGGVLTGEILRRFPESRVCGLDASPTMLEAASGALAPFGSRFEAVQFDLPSDGWRGDRRALWAVVSSLAVHHLDHEGKRRLFADVYGMLAPGGALVIADLLQPASEPARALAARGWDDAVRERSHRLRGDGSAFDAFVRGRSNIFHPGNEDPMDIPSPLAEQLAWLREAGFEGVDAPWVRAGHGIVCAYRGS
jgi:tRNA (cmo5U34)-methyltransferase